MSKNRLPSIQELLDDSGARCIDPETREQLTTLLEEVQEHYCEFMMEEIDKLLKKITFEDEVDKSIDDYERELRQRIEETIDKFRGLPAKQITNAIDSDYCQLFRQTSAYPDMMLILEAYANMCDRRKTPKGKRTQVLKALNHRIDVEGPGCVADKMYNELAVHFDVLDRVDEY